MKAAGGNRWGHRDATMILVAYRRDLREPFAPSAPPSQSNQPGLDVYESNRKISAASTKNVQPIESAIKKSR